MCHSIFCLLLLFYFTYSSNFSCCKALTFNILYICVWFIFIFLFVSIFIIIIIIFVFFCPLEMKCSHNGNLSQIFSILCSFNYRHQHCPTTCKLQGRHWYSCIVKKTNILQAYCVRLERLKYNYKSAIDYFRSWIALHLSFIVHVVHCLFSLHWICFRSLYLFPVHDKV